MGDKDELIPSTSNITTITSLATKKSGVEEVVEGIKDKMAESSFSSTDHDTNNLNIEAKKSQDILESPSTSAPGSLPNEQHRGRFSSNSPSSKLPNLYHKFVESFDAVLQNLASEEVKIPQKLPSLDIEGVANYIKEEKPKNVIFMVGAGISTSAGIPDFRTPGTGLYDNLAQFNLPDPHAIFDIDFFKSNPNPFFVLARELFHENVKPTTSHYFIRLMEEKGLLRRCFSQNIDTLEYLTGMKEDKIVNAHGSFHTSTCLKCKKKYDKKWLEEKLKDPENIVPKCPACRTGVVKPDIIFFGEKLPTRFFSAALADFPKCDLLIIMGTSLVVQPFASIVDQVAKDTPRLLINLEPVGQGVEDMLSDSKLEYGQATNIRDVFWQGTCDDGAMKLARLLGWEVELDALIKNSKK